MNMRKRLVMCILAAAVLLFAGCALTPRGSGESFSFVTIGDTRSDQPIVQPQVYRDSIEQINKLRPRPKFVVNVGDVIRGYTDDRNLIVQEWEEFDKVTSNIKPPFYLVVGNHDIWNEESHRIYTERYGPTYYSFDHHGSHFIILCSEEMGEVVKVTGEQLKWLAQDLEQNKEAAHIFAFVHRPLWASHRGMAESGWNENVHPLLAKYGVDIVFAGHDHEFVNYGVRDGVQYYVTGGGGAPLSSIGFYHFMVTTVEPEKVSSIVIDTSGNVLPDDVVTEADR